MRRKERKEKERGLWTTSPTVGTSGQGLELGPQNQGWGSSRREVG